MVKSMRRGFLGVACGVLVAGVVACGSTTTKNTPTAKAGPTPPATKILGTPGFKFSDPAGYTVFLETSNQVQLMHFVGGGAAEQLRFGTDIAKEKLSPTDPTMMIGGQIADVIHSGPGAGTDKAGFSTIAIVSYKGVQYQLACLGYAGYDKTLLTQGCASLAKSISFK